MRLEELFLERYGRFKDFRLALDGGGIRLHVIHGPNEAGKSTALEAISDLLFGFDPRTPYGFAHGYENLLIGATLSNRAGQTLGVKRRKGQKNTLLDAQGVTVLPDAALAPFLGGLSREAFEREFGLDYHRLRGGGDQMLEAKGDLARSLFQASGLADVVKEQETLKDAAEALWSPQRRATGKPLWAALGAYDDARKRMRTESLHAEDWSRAVDAERATRDALAARKTGLEALRRDRNRLQRLRGALPVLARLDALTGQWTPLADAPDLPADFADRWRRAVGQEAAAAAEVHRLTFELGALQTDLEALPAVGPLPAHAARIERMFQKSGDLITKRDDHPKLVRYLEECDGRLAQLIVQLGGQFTPAELERHRPAKPVIARIRERIGRFGALEAEVKARSEQAAAARDALREAEQAQQALGQPVDPAEARAALDEALKAGDLEARLAAAERAAGQAEAAATAALARLGWGTGTPAALAATPFPGREAVQEAQLARQALDNDHRRGLEARDKAQAEVRRFEGGLRDLEAGAEIPTPEALVHARRHREQGWRLIRGSYIDRTLEVVRATAEYAPETAIDLPAAYEEAVRRADDLVDRREREAQRVQRYLTLKSHAGEAREEAARQEAALVDITRRIADHQTRWAALWHASGIDPATPAERLSWLQRKDEAVQAAGLRLKAEDEVAGLRRQAVALRDHLLRAGAVLGLAGLDGQPTPALRDKVKAAIDQAARAWTDAERLGRERLRHQRAVDKACDALAAARQQRQLWDQAWLQDMPALGLPATASTVEAEAALEIWQAIEKELVDRRQKQDRLQGIESDLEAGRRDVAGLVAELGEDQAGLDGAPADALEHPQRLNQRLKAAQQVLTRREAILSRIAGHQAALAAAGSTRDQASQALAVLRASHGLDATAEPLVEAERAARRRALGERLAEAQRELEVLAAGFSEAELRVAVQGADPDALGAQLQAVEGDEKRLQQDLEDATRAALLASQQLEALRRRTGIQEAAQQARDAELRAAGYARRWVRLWAAQALLDAAIQRFRNTNEHPLIKRAGELFALIAGTGRNPIERLTVAYGKKDQPVLVALRRDGSRCEVEGMSDGTRDQLYLALRIAAVEAAAAAGEPMPFIADDLFITSDDERTGPGLKALAALGQVTQVLLFTHHRSVVDTARAVVEPDELRVHGLGEG